jgi:lycopene cyclase CruA
MVAATAKSRRTHPSPDLSDFRKRYPLTVASFGSLANREEWLRRIWETDARWQQAMSEQTNGNAQECVVRGAPPAGLAVEAEFEIIYAGGTLGLLHAGVMSGRYHRRVMVFDEQAVGTAHHDWNVSDDEIKELERAGLFTGEEIEAAVVNRYRASFVKFHDVASRIKTPPLWMDGVMDVAIEADKLLALAAQKIQKSESGSVLMDGLRFVRCYVQPSRVVLEVEETRTGRHKLFAARLFVDATEPNSPVARQLNDGCAVTHVRPTVGTVARGFARGTEPDKVDFSVGEILVSNEDARDHRQLMWESFAGSPRRDEYTTHLFFHDAVDSHADKSLLSLFEQYFETLPGYKRADAQWRVLKPVFGYLPGAHHRGRNNRPRLADERVLLIGDAAGLSSPLTFCGLGAHARHLRRLTHLTELALAGDLLDAASLSEINASEPRVAQMASLAELMRPAPRSAPPVVNETMNAMMAALHDLDEGVRREFFQDRMSSGTFKNLLSRTLTLYPRILHRVREHLGVRGTFWWLANIAESMWHERRRSHTQPPDEPRHDEDAAQKFARYLALYKNNHHANDL